MNTMWFKYRRLSTTVQLAPVVQNGLRRRTVVDDPALALELCPAKDANVDMGKVVGCLFVEVHATDVTSAAAGSEEVLEQFLCRAARL